MLALFGTSPGDPWYAMSVDQIRQGLLADYPVHERLPNSLIPAALAQFVVQERFRCKDQWPLVQIGPGIATFNTIDPAANAQDSAAALDAVWRQIRSTYPTAAPLEIAGAAYAVLERYTLSPSEESLQGLLHQLGLPDLTWGDGAPELGLVSPGPIGWDVTFKDVNTPDLTIGLTLGVHPTPDGDTTTVEWRRVITSALVRPAGDSIVPALVALAQRMPKLGQS